MSDEDTFTPRLMHEVLNPYFNYISIPSIQLLLALTYYSGRLCGAGGGAGRHPAMVTSDTVDTGLYSPQFSTGPTPPPVRGEHPHNLPGTGGNF